MRIDRLSFCVAAWAVLIAGAAASAADDELLPKSIKRWGRIIDPKGDCSVEEQDGAVSMTVIGRHDLSIELAERMDAPRVMREIEGDFIAMVKVEGGFRATGPSTIDTRRPYLGAGLLLWQDQKNYVRLEHASVDVDGQVFDYLGFEERKNGQPNVAYNQLRLKGDTVRLRLERRNGKLYSAAAYEAEQWGGYLPLQIELPAKVQIGVAAVSSSALPFVAQFSEFEVYRRVNSAAEQDGKD